MEGHVVHALVVDSLDDIDFARFRPVGANHPKGWPGAADTAGHVGKVEDDKAMVVLGSAG